MKKTSDKTIPKKTLNKPKIKPTPKTTTTKPTITKKTNPLTQTKTPSKNKSLQKVSTGIPKLDTLINKGFEKNSTNLIVGGTGSGKSIFGMQFLMEGLRKNESCIYITFEESKKTFYSNMKALGWDLEALEKNGKFFFLEYTPEKVKTMLEEGGGTIENLILKEKISRIVIDSITSFELLFKEELEKREAALSLFSMLRKWDCTTFLTYEGEPSRKAQLDSRILEFESDSIILLYFLRNKKQRNRYLEVLKMRGSNHSTSVYNFSIGKKGILLSSKPFIGNLRL